MPQLSPVRVLSLILFPIMLVSLCLAGDYPARPIEPPPHRPMPVLSRGPAVLRFAGDTVWVQPHIDETSCPGDAMNMRGGEATGGPGASETWCFEALDSCGTNPPWDALCWDHVDVRTMPSPMGTNYWHVDTYHCADEDWLGDYCLWCGSMALWTDGKPVECGMWEDAPGYGNEWNCVVELALDHNFDIRDGCDLYFDVRYDTECKYDYLYVEFWDGVEWLGLAAFNASSGNPGLECGGFTGGNPDYWGNTNFGQPHSARWQGRSFPDEPAFHEFLGSINFQIEEAPKFRWRFASDGSWSDADGRGNTDGAAFIDNVIVDGDHGSYYEEDFEGGPGSLGPEWSFPDPDPIRQGWHMAEDPDPPYEGGDGGDRLTCMLNSSAVWQARPEQGYPMGDPTRNGWYYRLTSPPVSITNSGCVVQYDAYMCALDYTCDYVDTKVRFHDSVEDRWCPWINIDGFIMYGGCFWWNINTDDDVTWLYDDGADQVQFAWDLMDVSSPGSFCHGKHSHTDYLVDNVSIGFFDGKATVFETRPIDLLHDTFHGNICAHNSNFDEYSTHELARYAGPPYDLDPLPWDQQFVIDVRDKDGIQAVTLHGILNGGPESIDLPMTLESHFDDDRPELGGTYYGTFCPTDFSLNEWAPGTTILYFVTCLDGGDALEYFPGEVDPSHPDHTGGAEDYLSFSIFPLFDPAVDKTRILLVDGYQRDVYDWDPCVGDLTKRVPLREIYENTLSDAGYSFDRFDINGAGGSQQIQPLDYEDYDLVFWFTGPDLSNNLIHEEAWKDLQRYLMDGGKAILAGDRLAQYSNEMEYWRLLAWPHFYHIAEAFRFRRCNMLGFDYLDEMPSGVDCPYVYLEDGNEPVVGRSGVPITFGDALVFRGCPHMRDMSWIERDSRTADETLRPVRRFPRSKYYVYTEPIFYVKTQTGCSMPDGAVGALYCEIGEEGELVFFNFDLSAMVNHTTQACDGDVPDPSPDFTAGTYSGRVETIGAIIKHLFGLQPDS